MTQDANQRAKAPQQWLVTVYDHLNRPEQTGIQEFTASFADHMAAAMNTAMPASYPSTSGGFTPLTKTFYDNYNWTSAEGNPVLPYMSTSLNSYFEEASDTQWPYPQAVASSSHTKGMVTGTKTSILGTSSFLYTANFYDDKGRLVQTRSTNASGTGNSDLSTTQYSWNDKPLRNIQRIYKNGSNSQNMVILTHYFYDELWRLIRVEKKVLHSNINSGAAPGSWTKILENQYDALGQLTRKNLGTQPGTSTRLAKQDFKYNIRGWLLGMNKDYITATGNNGQYFGFDLGYDKSGVMGTYSPQYNGNIGGMIWKSEGDGEKRKYDFDYDAASRLLKADFTQYTVGSFNQTAGVDFSVSGLQYDENGNIKTMTQKGWKVTGSTIIDSLVYSYLPHSNKLLQVTDRTNDPNTRLGDFKDGANSGDDYGYDRNGNLVTDLNKKVGAATGADLTTGGAITYNHLNLPSQIEVKNDNGTPKGTVTYIYDAAGNKLKKVVVETGRPAKTTLYIGEAVYENDTLQFIAHEEGRIRFKSEDSSLQWDYFLKDHLGNVRMVLTEEVKTTQYIPATMEANKATKEDSIFSNLSTSRSTLPSLYPVDTSYSSPNQYVAKVGGGGNPKIGPAMTLKVMAGDRFHVRVSSWYNAGGVTPGPSSNPLSELVTALAGSFGVVSGTKATTPELGSSGVLSLEAQQFFAKQNNSSISGMPKAYLNWVLLDEQFKFVEASSGADPVGASVELTIHQKQNLPVHKSGYLYVYVSNETGNIPVFFDNLQVTHIKGPILEETHYYPFGLTMYGISNKAANGKEVKQKFVGQELDKELDINYYQFAFRTHDPQIGRFIQIDPLASEYVYNSTYAYAENDVIRAIDVEGLEKYIVTNEFIQNKNGKTSLLRTTNQEVKNPYGLGNGTLTNSTIWHEKEDANGKLTYSGSSLNVYVPSFSEKFLNMFSGGPQLMIYGSGKGGDGIGSEPDYSKPIEVFNFAEFDELIGVVLVGLDNYDLKGVDTEKLPELTKQLFDKAVEDNPNNSKAKELKEGYEKSRVARAGEVYCRTCKNTYAVSKDSTVSFEKVSKPAKDTIDVHQ